MTCILSLAWICHHILSLEFNQFVLKTIKTWEASGNLIYNQTKDIYFCLLLSSMYARLQWSQLLNSLSLSSFWKPMSTKMYLYERLVWYYFRMPTFNQRYFQSCALLKHKTMHRLLYKDISKNMYYSMWNNRVNAN